VTVPVSAASGQMPSQAKTKVRRGKSMWLAIAALVLVGGGVTIGVVASGGGDKREEAAKRDEPAPPPPAPAPQPQPQPPPAPVPEPPAPPSDDDSDTGDDDMAMLDGYISMMTPEQKKQLPKPARDALAKYGSFAAVPKKERAKLAGQLLAITQQMTMGGLDGINSALAGGEPETPRGKAGLQRHNGAPPGFDPKRVDLDAAVAWATADVKKSVRDAQLVRIDAENTYPDGHLDLTVAGFASDGGTLMVRFTSPTMIKQSSQCAVMVLIDRSGGQIYPVDQCDPAIPAPRCSAKQVWQRAAAKHKGFAGPAALNYYRNPVSRKVGWFFNVFENGSISISEQIPDDC
jgi:hypothetical protein